MLEIMNAVGFIPDPIYKICSSPAANIKVSAFSAYQTTQSLTIHFVVCVTGPSLSQNETHTPSHTETTCTYSVH